MRPLITIDARMFHFSGIGTYIQNLLPRVIKNMDDVNFCVLGNINELFSLRHFNNVQLKSSTADIYSINEQLELIRTIPKETDIFWSPHYNIPLLYKGNLVVTIHDVFHLAMSEFVHGIVKREYAKFMFNAVSKKANKIISVSHFTELEINKFLKCKQSNISVIHNGVDKSWFQINESNFSTYEFPYILYVGNVKPHKNLTKLIKAFELLKEIIPHKLVIVGKKEGFLSSDDQVIQYAQKDSNNILFTGFVDDDQLKNLVNNADVFVLPSLYEGFGLPPLEAMACGTLVAVSNIPALLEVCGNCASYFNPNDEVDIANSIKKIILDDKEEARNEKRMNGIHRASQFTWENCAKEHESVFRELIKEGGV